MEIEIGRGKKARRAYGFDDIAIVPSRRTRDPDDVDISWTLGPLPLRAAAAGLGDGRRRLARDGAASSASSAASPSSTSRASGRATRTPTSSSSASPQLPKDAATREMQEIYQEPIKPELIAQRIEEIKAEPGVVAAASLTPQRVRALLRARARGRARHPRHPGHGHLGRARLADHRAAQPQGVHPRARRSRSSSAAAPPTTRACTSCAPARPACSSASARAPRAPRAACSASASRRRPRSPTSPARARSTCSRPASTSRSSPTAACAPAATSSKAIACGADAVMIGSPLARAYEAPGPRLPLGHGDLPPDAPARRARADDAERHAARRSSSAPPTRTTARFNLMGGAAHLDGDVRLQGHRRVQPRRADDRPVAADRGQGAAARRRAWAWARAARRRPRTPTSRTATARPPPTRPPR